MKPTRSLLLLTGTITASLCMLPLAALFLPQSARAGSLDWDGSDTVSSGAQGGTGTWDANATANWWDGAADVVWPNSGTDNDAVFGGSNGIVSIAAGGVTANDITFNTSGYTIQNNTLTLNGTTSIWTVAGTSSSTATISASVNGAAGMTFNKAGGGTLTFTGANLLIPNVDNTSANMNINGGGKLAITAGLTRLAQTVNLTRTIGIMNIGDSSSGNTLEVSGTGQLITEKTRIGFGSSGGNSMVVSTPGNASSTANYSVWSVGSGETGANGSMVIGGSSSNNSLTVNNGAYYRVENSSTATWTLGLNAGANNNSIQITGSSGGNPSTLFFTANQILNVGQAGSYNTLEVSNGALFKASRLGVGDGGGAHNTATIVGTGAANSATITLSGGTNAILEIGSGATADYNSVSIQAGGVINLTGSGTTRNFSIGGKGQQNAQAAGGNNNYLEVTGANSAFNMTAALPLAVGGTATGAGPGTVTDGGSGNHLDINNGGSMTLTGAPVYALGTNTSINLGNGTGIGTLTVGAATGYTPGVYLKNADGRLNFNGGRLIAGASGALVSGAGKVDLLGAAYVSTALTNTIDSVIQGIGSFTKEGVGTLELTQINTYTGDTIVTATGGILRLDNAYLADSSAVRLFTGGKLDLNTGTTDNIAALYFDGTAQADGKWGAIGNVNADFQTAFITGTGLLNVVSIPEPAAALLGGLGLLALARRRRND